MGIMHGFHAHTIDLSTINKANVVMIPKKETLDSMGDFRPISVINMMPKLISKVLANRLRSKLPQLILPNQTAFIKGRQISKNFISTREVLQHIQETGRAGVFIKLDFAKSFDAVE